MRQQQHAHRERAQQRLQDRLVQVARIQRAELAADVDHLRVGQVGERSAQLLHIDALFTRLQAQQGAPGAVRGAGHQQSVQCRSEWCALQRGAVQQRLAARGLHVFDEAGEAPRR